MNSQLRPGHRPSRARALSAAAVLCWLCFAVVTGLVLTGKSADIDRSGLLLWRGADLHPLGPAGLLEPIRDITALGGVLLRSLAVLATFAGLWMVQARRPAAVLLLTVLSGWIANSLLKHLFARPRPDIVPHLAEAGGMSFPSGHSFNGALVYLAIALALAARSDRAIVRCSLVSAAAGLSLSIAFTRIWLGVHWPSDVIAGWLAGAGWAFAVAALFHRHKKTVAANLPPPQ